MVSNMIHDCKRHCSIQTDKLIGHLMDESVISNYNNWRMLAATGRIPVIRGQSTPKRKVIACNLNQVSGG